MYLAKLHNASGSSFEIRQSYLTEKNSYDYQTVFKLGDNPGRFIEPFDDHIVLFSHDLLEAVSSQITDDAESVLERLLWQYLPKETQRRLTMFQDRGVYRAGLLSDLDRKEIASQIHLFDRRRLYYLRYGAVDQSRLSKLHEKCCRPLLGQCRDEREYYFATEEKVLESGNYLQYIYAIFNLQKYFHQSFAKWLPEALARDEMADHFIKELCRLNDDHRFWQKEKTTRFLHYHLTRYLIMFFDYSPSVRSFSADFAKRFMADHRTFRWPERKPSNSPEKVSEIFATPYAELKILNREQLNRLYRQKAMQLHPDRGGDHDLFIQLTEVYNELLRTK